MPPMPIGQSHARNPPSRRARPDQRVSNPNDTGLTESTSNRVTPDGEQFAMRPECMQRWLQATVRCFSTQLDSRKFFQRRVRFYTSTGRTGRLLIGVRSLASLHGSVAMSRRSTRLLRTAYRGPWHESCFRVTDTGNVGFSLLIADPIRIDLVRLTEERVMLVLSRKLGQSFHLGPDVRVTIVKIDRNSVRIGIEAPGEVPDPARGDRLRAARILRRSKPRPLELGLDIAQIGQHRACSSWTDRGRLIMLAWEAPITLEKPSAPGGGASASLNWAGDHAGSDCP